MESVDTILARLTELYERAVHTLRSDILAFARKGTLPSPTKRLDGSYAYPELVLHFAGGEPQDPRSRAWGRLHVPGTYATTVTRPALFADYLREQLELISGDYAVEMEVRTSRQEIPFPYVLDGDAGAEMAGISPQELARHFPATELALIGDELADGIDIVGGETIPLSLFDGLRADFSLARLAHYTGTSP
jgi:AMP nucleosidase